MGHYTVYTAGHGELDWDGFTRLLGPYSVEIVVDVRSNPFTTNAPDFNRDRVEYLARRDGMEYLWLGSKLGALTENGRVDYIAREREARYRSGIQELLDLAHDRTVCVLGGASDPERSHRHLLIAQTLLRQHVEVRHILHGGAALAAQADLFHVGPGVS
ncbi:MAG: DUF488 domain-containing protein [bacterium]|nr:DUF488 domain-containing protein [bacterium]